jgi:hypothetical protein
MKKLALLSLPVLLIAAIWSCKDKDDSGTATFRVRMHDQAILYDSVNVDVQQVRIQVSGQGWTILNTQAGMYNLLDFQNGIDTLIVPPQQIPSGQLNQFRLILGQNNYVVIAGVQYPLALSSQDATGLKINLNEQIVAGQNYTLIVDFDASQSVLLQGNGTYRLKPVLHADLQ